MNTNTTIPTKVFERLYRAALRLERDWANVEMSGLFLPRRIEDAWRLLTRKGLDPTWTEDECADHAERLLHYVWERNAVRDYVRQRKMREEGKRLPPVSLNLPGLENNPALWVLLDSGQSRDPWDSLLFHDLAVSLLRRGFAEKHVWAFFWYVVAGEEWQEVALLLKTRLGVEVQPNTLRQWPKRYFGRIVAALQTLLAEEGAARLETDTPLRPAPRSRSAGRQAEPGASRNTAVSASSARVTRRR